MDFISVEQIKAARALLGWTQADLAKHSGLKDDQVRSYESKRAKPLHVIEAVTRCLVSQGMDFVEGGVVPRTVRTYTLDSYMELLEDISHSMPEGGEILKHCVDDRRSTPEVIEKVAEMTRAGIKERVTIADDNDFITGNPDDYRQIPSDFVSQSEVILVYLNRVAFFADNKAIVTVSNGLSDIFRKQFQYWWKNGKAIKKD